MIKKLIFLLSVFLLGLYLIGCFPASNNRNEDPETKENTETTENTNNTQNPIEEGAGGAIVNIARTEQQNEMYSPSIDSTHLYWLDNRLILLNHATKCNIFALNVLYKAGFKTPKVNALTYDLADTTKFKDIMPVVGISDPTDAKKGDLIVWNGHVIIFETLLKIKQDLYAQAWWAGTRQSDNGDNVINNVCYGKYRLNGYYVVRRPLKK
jgi:hypothetical protein